MSQTHGKFFDATNHLTGVKFVRAVRKFFLEEAFRYHPTKYYIQGHVVAKFEQNDFKSLWNLVTPQTPVEWKTYGR